MRGYFRAYLLLALVGTISAGGCQSFMYYVGLKQVPVMQAAPPVSQLGRSDSPQAQQWEAGRAIYTSQCASCHKPMPIREFAVDDWKNSIIPSMSTKAKLSLEQTESLKAYVLAVKNSPAAD
jgi:mono/diheme cytochrome c family protein